MTRQCSHGGTNALAIRYLAHWAARRKLVTRRSKALYRLCAAAPSRADNSAYSCNSASAMG